ncbi:hypothetical protein RM549_09925 [Salegentibacter sp. F188]|uniref:Uncharacterized protein n=1 Tax=Autumnicola patrickiae TaxID=3075591 RepID=A0ABU3E4C5_9FLAO|nr:hypothetical protein [Salegentibacter sp. F188]MDT0690102.1 hypothetical protein [Salegentibacter sp. F188]
MKTLENIAGFREGDLTHRKSFLNIQQPSNRGSWYSRRRYN